MPGIGIRADANKIIASGHVMRCITIAKELLALGAEVTFFVADEESRRFFDTVDCTWGTGLVVLGTDWQDMEGELPILSKELKDRDISILLVDSYKVTKEYFSELSKVCALAYMDDLGKEAYPVDLLVNYSGYYEQIGYDELYRGVLTRGGEPVRMLLGLKYAPLRQQFWREDCGGRAHDKKVDSAVEPVTNINADLSVCTSADGDEDERTTWLSDKTLQVLLTAGGADMHGMLLGVLEEMAEKGIVRAAADLKDEHESEVQGTDKNRELVDGTECYDSCTGDARGIDIHVVVGSLVRDIDGVRRFAECHENVILHENVENMAALMRSCDVAIAAAGTMLTECAAIGLPAIYYQVADNQKFNVEFWQRTGGMVFAGDVSSGDALEKQRVLASICDNIKRIMNNESDLLNMKASLSGITDGRGAIRISKAIIDL